MKILVVYYSCTGKTRTIGHTLSTLLNCDCEEIIDMKNRKGIFGWLSSAYDAFRKKMTTIQKINYNPKDYDLVIIGTPNWAGMPTPAIRTYLNQNLGNIKNVAFFCTMGSDDIGKVFTELEAICQIKPKALLSIKSSEVEKNLFSDKVQTFIEKIKL
ncbi:MAG: hypothetical protein N2201_05365 [candidate division WOR-3 bacterium]|nr:hypothetical protein [candidate division WOR-3 bacterium]